MLIDWFTVVAQLINFAILLLALKFLLYDRIVDAMEERRRRIAGRVTEAEEQRREAEAAAARLQEERRQLESRRDDLIAAARREAQEHRDEMLEQARAEVQNRERQWQESVRTRQDRLLEELQRATAQHAVAVSSRALRDLVDADLEQRIVTAFLRRIDTIQGTESDEIREALNAADADPLVVTTGFDLSAHCQEEIRRELHERVAGDNRRVVWKTDPDLVAGVTIQVGARTIGWSIESYLRGLHQVFDDVIRDHLGSDGAPAADDTRDEGLNQPDAGPQRSPGMGAP
jgi:F-type H+-transporting ATPase subunit b